MLPAAERERVPQGCPSRLADNINTEDRHRIADVDAEESLCQGLLSRGMHKASALRQPCAEAAEQTLQQQYRRGRDPCPWC